MRSSSAVSRLRLFRRDVLARTVAIAVGVPLLSLSPSDRVQPAAPPVTRTGALWAGAGTGTPFAKPAAVDAEDRAVRRSDANSAVTQRPTGVRLVSGSGPGVRTSASTRSRSFSPSGLSGGGFVNVVAVSPHDRNVLLAGTDTAGIQRSTDGGRNWRSANAGITVGGFAVAAVAFDASRAGVAFAALGDNGAGGVAMSTDAGSTWAVRSSAPRFEGRAGGNRIVGRLLAFAQGAMYAGTLDGVLRSIDDGASWSVVAPSGSAVRGLAADSSAPDTLYAALGAGRVIRVENAHSPAPMVQQLSAAPPAEELALTDDGTLVAAAGANGVSVSTDRGATWRVTVAPSSAVWLTVTAAGTNVFAGATNPLRDGAGRSSVVVSNDRGLTWRSTTSDPARIHGDQMGGAGGDPWWLAAEVPGIQIGRAAYTASDIALAGDDLVVAGRSGLWVGRVGGAEWYPAVRGLGLTVVRQIAAGTGPGEFHVALADWVLRSSTDGLAGAGTGAPGNASSGHAVAVSGATTLVGLGDNLTNTGGEVWQRDAGLWRPLDLGGATGGKRIVALAARPDSAGNLVVLAAVERGGLWRKVGNAAWTNVSLVAAAGPARGWGGSLVFSGEAAFYYDRDRGVFRSLDAGRTWSLWFEKKSAAALTGYLAVDPTTPGRVYASVGFDGVYRLDGATSGAAKPVRLSASALPGPLTVGPDGILFVGTLGLGGEPPRLLQSPDAGQTWVDVADATYRASAAFPASLSLSSDGSLAVGLGGSGVLLGREVVSATS